jgi:hypothetical protein
VRALRAALVVAILALPAMPSASSATLPTIRLSHSGDEAQALIWPGEGMSLSAGAWIEAVGGAFELHGADGRPREVRRFPSANRDFLGLSSFFLLELHDDAGNRVARIRLPFCPATQEAARIDDSGPDLPTMPASCGGTAVTQAMVWGIDAGWAVSGPQTFGLQVDVPDGAYDATLSVSSRWVRDLAITGPTSVSFPLSVERITFDEEPFLGKAASSNDDIGGGVPDLASLPAWDIQIFPDESTGADLLTFAATVWNAGTGPLVVEGFRASGEDEMTAYQYFYEDGRPVRRVDAGSFMFHAAGGHNHWHFLDFAQYSLLDRTTGDRVLSQKEAFCLTWTDPIDLTDPDAVWSPGATSLQTACGSPSSIWIRETLPVGWGDTYTQFVAGQSFDITSLPNGRYAIEVGANPNGRLVDLKTSNDVALREIELGGTRGARTVRTLTTFP